MNERINPPGGEYDFTPEDWDGHDQDDDCPWQEDNSNVGEFMQEYRMADQIAKPVLTRFLASPDRTVLRKYKRGEVLRFNHLSPEAIVRFSIESYLFGKPTFGEDQHRTADFWGVVCALPNGKTVLMRYFTKFSSAAELFPGFTHKGDHIDPEVTAHQRFISGYSEPDALIRYRDLALYSAGKAAPQPEKERGRFRLPNLGSIFGQPIPQPT